MKKDINGLTEAEFLASYDIHKYPAPALTADILIFCGDEPSVLMIRRKGHPFIGQWALPGGFVNPGETADSAARRELFEETGIKDVPISQLEFISSPGRDPRGWIVTQSYIAYLKKAPGVSAGDDAERAEWFNAKLSGSELLLENKNHRLSAKLEITKRKNLFGEYHDVKITQSGSIAFDHAAVIAKGLLFLKSILPI